MHGGFGITGIVAEAFTILLGVRSWNRRANGKYRIATMA
jgi:hypothetical protein